MQNLARFAIKINFKIKCLNRWNWRFGVLVFKIFPGENTPGFPYIGRTFIARMFCPSTLNSFLSLCITNFIVQIIVLSRPSKPGNTDSVSQNFKKLGKHIPGLPHFRVCPPHFLERIVALGKQACKQANTRVDSDSKTTVNTQQWFKSLKYLTV